MSWHGPQHQGAARDRKAAKRAEAEVRGRDVMYERTAIYRLRVWGELSPEDRLLKAIFGTDPIVPAEFRRHAS